MGRNLAKTSGTDSREISKWNSSDFFYKNPTMNLSMISKSYFWGKTVVDVSGGALIQILESLQENPRKLFLEIPEQVLEESPWKFLGVISGTTPGKTLGKAAEILICPHSTSGVTRRSSTQISKGEISTRARWLSIWFTWRANTFESKMLISIFQSRCITPLHS